MSTPIKLKTVKLLARFIRPLCEEGLLSVPEMNEILAQLRHLAQKGEALPDVVPKLLNQPEVAEMLSISLANFKKMEREGQLPIRRKMIGSSVRYRNTDVIKYILLEDTLSEISDADQEESSMGEAKRRGSFEERKAESITKQQEQKVEAETKAPQPVMCSALKEQLVQDQIGFELASKQADPKPVVQEVPTEQPSKEPPSDPPTITPSFKEEDVMETAIAMNKALAAEAASELVVAPSEKKEEPQSSQVQKVVPPVNDGTLVTQQMTTEQAPPKQGFIARLLAKLK